MKEKGYVVATGRNITVSWRHAVDRFESFSKRGDLEHSAIGQCGLCGDPCAKSDLFEWPWSTVLLRYGTKEERNRTRGTLGFGDIVKLDRTSNRIRIGMLKHVGQTLPYICRHCVFKQDVIAWTSTTSHFLAAARLELLGE